MKQTGIILFDSTDLKHSKESSSVGVNLFFDKKNSGSNLVRKTIHKDEYTTLVRAFHKKLPKDNLEHSYRLEFNEKECKCTKCEKFVDNAYCSYILYFFIEEKTVFKLCVTVQLNQKDYEVLIDETGIEYQINPNSEQEDFWFILTYKFNSPDKENIEVPTDELMSTAMKTIENKDKLLDDYCRVIGENIRYGINSLIINNKIRYYAFHGTPARNDDYFITVEISEDEFYEIEHNFDCCKDFSFAETDNYVEKFKEKYINNRPIILEGFNVLLDRYYLRKLSKEDKKKLFKIVDE